MKLGQVRDRASSADHADRRLVGGLLVSLLLHGIVLLLQFGAPGMGVPGAAPPLSVRIASADSAPFAPLALPPAPALPPDPTVAAPLPAPTPGAVTGMRLIDPVPAPEPVSAPPTVSARAQVKQGTPRRARRIAAPLLDHDALVAAQRVIAQDATLNDFSVPLVRPEDANQKTVDQKEAQHGEDDGDAPDTAALEAQAARAGKLKAEADAKARKLADEENMQAVEEAQQLAAREQEARTLAEAQQQAEKSKAEDEQRTAAQQQQQRQQQKAEQDAAMLRQQLALQQDRKAEEQERELQRAQQDRLKQQRTEQFNVEQQRADQVKAEQQRAELAKAEKQRAEQQRAEQHRAEQARAQQQRAEQQRAEQARAQQQKAEQQRIADQRAADQQAADQRAADQRAADQRAADQRGRELAGPQPGGIAASGTNPGTGGGGAGSGVQIPKNLMGSDLANRARDLVKGLDVLRGAPPPVRAHGDRRAVVGASERDLPLKMYVESWRQKIERNGAINYPRSWADMVRIDPLVSVAVRKDGTVEDVTILVSSGRPEMDEAVRRIVRVNARYSPFPQNIAERYDVIEIRRVWRFGDVLKLMEEVR